jgi:hypothetical protein
VLSFYKQELESLKWRMGAALIAPSGQLSRRASLDLDRDLDTLRDLAGENFTMAMLLVSFHRIISSFTSKFSSPCLS